MTVRDRWQVLSAIVGQCTLAVALGIASPVMAASEAECSALLRRPDVYFSGKLSAAYSMALMDSGRWVAADGTVDRVTIMNGCLAGVFALLTMAAVPNSDPMSMRSEIAAKWGRFSPAEITALKSNDDLVSQIQSKYSLDEAQAQRDVDAFANGRQL
jgi:hypothetical protein